MLQLADHAPVEDSDAKVDTEMSELAIAMYVRRWGTRDSLRPWYEGARRPRVKSEACMNSRSAVQLLFFLAELRCEWAG